MPQPIDPNTELARMTAVERIQQATDRASIAAQSRQAMEAEERRLGTEREVMEADAKSDEVDREQKRRNPFMGRRRKRERDGNSDGKERKIYNASEMLDELDDDIHDLDLRV